VRYIYRASPGTGAEKDKEIKEKQNKRLGQGQKGGRKKGETEKETGEKGKVDRN
jgi:hypothetical protein